MSAESVPTARPAATRSGAAKLIVPVLIGGLVSLSLGAYSRLHEPALNAVNLSAIFTSAFTMKVWLATVAFGFALVQFVSALAMYGKLPGVKHAPSWTGTLHRWSGRLAFLFAVPVAVHCLYAFGFE